MGLLKQYFDLHWRSWLVGFLAIVAFFAFGSDEAVKILMGLGLSEGAALTVIHWAKFIDLLVGILGYSPLKKNPLGKKSE